MPELPDDPNAIEIRRLRSHEDYAACVQLQYETWGDDFDGAVPRSLLQVTQRVGGVSGGAFTPEGRMVGCVYGITGTQSARIVHWSDILAITPDARRLGLGRRLKLFQRNECLAVGCDVMHWTYDPLQALNANFNLNKLGARPIEYVVDMYGDTGSDLHTGIGTDRFVVQWDLESSRVADILDGDRPKSPKGTKDAPVVNTDEGAPYPDAPLVRVEIPADINKAKQAHPEAGAEWRQSTRKAFVHYLVERGYTVAAFIPPKDAAFRGYYVLKGKAE